MECPRKYFYAYVLGWQREEPNLHLVFGEAWHLAMETLLRYGYSNDAVELAYLSLEKKYREHFSPIHDESNFPKVPGFAFEMLQNYVRKHADDHANYEVLYTEIAGSVSVGSRSIYFKTDSILYGLAGPLRGKYFSLEHKTSSRRDPDPARAWSLKTQIGTYTHVLYCLYPAAEVYGIRINMGIFQKTRPDFLRIDLPRTPAQMETWLWTVNQWLDQIDREFDRLASCTAADSLLFAFPMNSEACASWSGCEWHDFCSAWSNPLQHCDQVPFGYVVRYWDPREIEATTKMEI
jgi:hypothetical protein